MSVPMAKLSSHIDPVHGQRKPVVVVGTGMAGIHAVNEILRWDPYCPIVIYGAEPWTPYDRVKLSSMLAGDIQSHRLVNELMLSEGHQVQTRYNQPIIAIDRYHSRVTTEDGQTQVYDKLVLATGSRPHIPSINGTDLPGVFTFRDMSDAEKLMARQARSRHTVVLGGGLLGLEAARAMQRGNTQVTVIEHAEHLMYNQLDDAAAELLRETMLAMGIKIVLMDSVQAITGEATVKAVQLRSGREIPCDTVIIATGIRANSELALDAGLSVGKGVRVNDSLQTSDPDIYAVGECCEHRERLYGLVAPALEQASVAAHNIVANQQPARYQGSLLQTRLKVVGVSVLSMGDVHDLQRPDAPTVVVYEKPEAQVYRKIVLRNHRLVGVIAVGDTHDAALLTHAFETGKIIWPWQVYRFRRSGELWEADTSTDVRLWPGNATVCNCRSVDRKTLTAAMEAGANSIEALMKKTGACTVCGSCQPLLASLCGQPDSVVKVKSQPVLVGLALVSLLLAVAFLFNNPLDEAYRVSTWWLSGLWLDSFAKQMTGFVLLGLSFTGVLISLSKRWGKSLFRNFTAWKSVHVASGVAILLALLIHTGVHFGGYLNTLLVCSFLLAALAGMGSTIAAGLGAGGNQRLRRNMRSLSNWSHVLLLWPFPVLVGVHIFTVYYY